MLNASNIGFYHIIKSILFGNSSLLSLNLSVIPLLCNIANLIECMATSMLPDYNSQIMNESDLITVKAPVAGILNKMKTARDEVRKGEIMAVITDPYVGEVIAEIRAPEDGIIFFAHNKPLALQNTPLFKVFEV